MQTAFVASGPDFRPTTVGAPDRERERAPSLLQLLAAAAAAAVKLFIAAAPRVVTDSLLCRFSAKLHDNETKAFRPLSISVR